MSIEKKKKDHLSAHAGVSLVLPAALECDDPLKFWTNHRTENFLVDLNPFADGEFENPNPRSPTSGYWGGPFTGRPQLIAELAPAMSAHCVMLTKKTVEGCLGALRAWWRLFDTIEATSAPSGQPVLKVTSVAHLNALHEAAAHQCGMTTQNFNYFRLIADAARKLLPTRLRDLKWISPGYSSPDFYLIPEDQARDIKTALKQNWEGVRHVWKRNDRIRNEAVRRAALESPAELSDEEEVLLKNLQHFQQVQQETGLRLPSGEQLQGRWASSSSIGKQGLALRLMRSILFPTVEEADIAFHLALMNSGWNPSTLTKIDATSPFLLNNHPKDAEQLVLSTEAKDDTEDDGEETLYAEKARAGYRAQFCVGKRSQLSSAPMVVEAYLARVVPLRETLQEHCEAALKELSRLRATSADHSQIAMQVMRVQELEEGRRSVWLYVDQRGSINWVNWRNWKRYAKPDGSKGQLTYLDLVRQRLNARRAERGCEEIPKITPTDFRKIYARWVYVQSSGNILAVMLALGHKSPQTTLGYLRTNIFAAENDESIMRFMTHFFAGLGSGEIDLTKLAQLVRHGNITPEMEVRLIEFRALMRSRIGVGCADPRHPPKRVAPGHVAGQLCGTQRCLKQCDHARFLPEAMNGIAMRVEELILMSDHLPRESWLRGEFQEELEVGESLLEMFSGEATAEARATWRARILSGDHLIPGFGRIDLIEGVP